MKSFLRPRLASLDVYASTVLVALGVTACSVEILDPDDDGPEGGAGAGNGGSRANGMGSAQGGFGEGATSEGGAGQGGAPESHCANPQPIIVDGMDTGVDTCDGGHYRRRQALACPA